MENPASSISGDLPKIWSADTRSDPQLSAHPLEPWPKLSQTPLLMREMAALYRSSMMAMRGVSSASQIVALTEYP